ncbi:hypothetical protein ACFX2C_002483 [Malus domestica]
MWCITCVPVTIKNLSPTWRSCTRRSESEPRSYRMAKQLGSPKRATIQRAFAAPLHPTRGSTRMPTTPTPRS